MIMDILEKSKKTNTTRPEQLGKQQREGSLTYDFTQVISAHAHFGEHLHIMHKTESPVCTFFVTGQLDSVQHTIIKCLRWSDEKRPMSGRHHVQPG